MSEDRTRLDKILNEIKQLKASVNSLKREREDLLVKNKTLQEKLNKRNEEQGQNLQQDNEEIKKVIEEQMAEIDNCLELLKTV